MLIALDWWNLFRRTSQQFPICSIVLTCWIAYHPEGPICSLPMWTPAYIKWCSMHVLNLGVCLWSCGSTLRVLLDKYRIWGDGSQNEGDRLAIAYEGFRSWTKARKITQLDWSKQLPGGFINFTSSIIWPMVLIYFLHWLMSYFLKIADLFLRQSQPRFTTKRLKSFQHPYPELQAKAFNASCKIDTSFGGMFLFHLIGWDPNSPDHPSLPQRCLLTRSPWAPRRGWWWDGYRTYWCPCRRMMLRMSIWHWWQLTCILTWSRASYVFFYDVGI